MDGLTMDYQLNVPAILRRGEELFGDKEIVSRLPDKSWHRYTYADFARRTKQLALALRNELGLVDGDRVGTFAWNHHEHLETYIGAPVGGFVTHTLNLRLHPDDLTYIATHARRPRADRRQDAVAARRGVQGPGRLRARDRDRCRARRLPARSTSRSCSRRRTRRPWPYRDIDERSAAAMCYTSGTTGQPKGVVYSHRAIAIHALDGAVELARDELRRRRACPSCRCSTRTPGASRSRAPRRRRSTSTPARTSIPSRCSTPSRARR